MRKSVVAVVLVLAVAACFSTARSRGARDARDAIERGEPCLRFIGLPRFEIGRLDGETGLPRSTVGCIVSDERTAYVAGWNDETRRALRAGELDAYLLKEKVTTRAAVEAAYASGGARVIRLAAGTPPAVSPGGRFAVEVAPKSEGSDHFEIFVTDRESGEREDLIFLGGDHCDVRFDHEGTTLLVRDDAYGSYMTFDLGTGLFMQGFPAGE